MVRGQSAVSVKSYEEEGLDGKLMGRFPCVITLPFFGVKQ